MTAKISRPRRTLGFDKGELRFSSPVSAATSPDWVTMSMWVLDQDSFV